LIVKEQRLVTQEALDAFWNTVKEIGVWQWKGFYSCSDVLVSDGVHWELEIVHTTNRKQTSGHNVFPPDVIIGNGRSNPFHRFCQAVNKLIGQEYYQY